MSDDAIDPGLARMAEEAQRLEPALVRAEARTSSDFKTVLVLTVAPAGRHRVPALVEALRAFRRQHDLAVEFLVVSGTDPQWQPRMPQGWPP